MDSFKKYLNDKILTNEYSSNYINEGIKDFFKSFSSEKIKKYVAVNVSFEKSPIIDNIVKTVEDVSKTAGTDKDNIETAIKDKTNELATKTIELFFKILSGNPINDDSILDKEHNLRKHFRFMVTNGKGITAYFEKVKTNDKDITDENVAASDFKYILMHNPWKDLPSIPEHAITIADENLSNGLVASFGDKQPIKFKNKFDKFLSIQQNGINELINHIAKNFDSIVKKAKKDNQEESRHNSLGDDVDVYYIRWKIEPEKLAKRVYGIHDPIELTEYQISNLYCSFFADVLTKFNLIKQNGNDFEFVNKEHGYCGYRYTETSLRLFFRDRSAANTFADDASQYANFGSAVSVKRPEKTLDSFETIPSTDEFCNTTIFETIIMPSINKERKIAEIKIKFNDNIADAFKKFNADTSLDDSLKSYLSNIFNTAASDDIKEYIVGYSSDGTSISVYVNNMDIVDALANKYKSETSDKNVSAKHIMISPKSLAIIGKAKIFDDLTNESTFKKLIDYLKEIANNTDFQLGTYAVIGISAKKLAYKLKNMLNDKVEDNIDLNDIIAYIMNLRKDPIPGEGEFKGFYIVNDMLYLVYDNDNISGAKRRAELLNSNDIECSVVLASMDKLIVNSIASDRRNFENKIKITGTKFVSTINKIISSDYNAELNNTVWEIQLDFTKLKNNGANPNTIDKLVDWTTTKTKKGEIPDCISVYPLKMAERFIKNVSIDGFGASLYEVLINKLNKKYLNEDGEPERIIVPETPENVENDHELYLDIFNQCIKAYMKQFNDMMSNKGVKGKITHDGYRINIKIEKGEFNNAKDFILDICKIYNSNKDKCTIKLIKIPRNKQLMHDLAELIKTEN